MRQTIKIISPSKRQGECLPSALAAWEAKGWKRVGANSRAKPKAPTQDAIVTYPGDEASKADKPRKP